MVFTISYFKASRLKIGSVSVLCVYRHHYYYFTVFEQEEKNLLRIHPRYLTTTRNTCKIKQKIAVCRYSTLTSDKSPDVKSQNGIKRKTQAS